MLFFLLRNFCHALTNMLGTWPRSIWSFVSICISWFSDDFAIRAGACSLFALIRSSDSHQHCSGTYVTGQTCAFCFCLVLFLGLNNLKAKYPKRNFFRMRQTPGHRNRSEYMCKFRHAPLHESRLRLCQNNLGVELIVYSGYRDLITSTYTNKVGWCSTNYHTGFNFKPIWL